MKQLPKACCICFLALASVACSTVSEIDAGFRNLDLGADTYIARSGETLETIAFRYRMSPGELASLNPGLANKVAVGTRVNLRRYTSGVARTTPSARQDTEQSYRSEAVSTSPVNRPRAIPDRGPESRGNGSVYAPAVSAVVSDMVLLAPERQPTSADRQGQSMRNGVIQPYSAQQQEFVEEEYIHQPGPLDRQTVDSELQKWVGRWTWPTQGQVARGFAPETEGRHGVDIAGLPGQSVVAALDGTVAYSGKDPSGAGNLILIRHDNDLLTAYSHTRDLYVAENDTVRAGDPIATLGSNSRQESVLRFEVRQDGNSLNPMDFLSNP